MARLRDKALDPGTVRAGFNGDTRAGMFLRKTPQAFAVAGIPRSGMDRSERDVLRRSASREAAGIKCCARR
jgi:hypothetical protein